MEQVEGGSVLALLRVVEEGEHCRTSSQVGASLVLGDGRPARGHWARPSRAWRSLRVNCTGQNKKGKQCVGTGRPLVSQTDRNPCMSNPTSTHFSF